MFLDVNINLFCLFLEALLPKIPYWRGIVNTFELVFCLIDAHKLFIFVLDETNRHNNLKIILDKQTYIYSAFIII